MSSTLARFSLDVAVAVGLTAACDGGTSVKRGPNSDPVRAGGSLQASDVVASGIGTGSGANTCPHPSIA